MGMISFVSFYQMICSCGLPFMPITEKGKNLIGSPLSGRIYQLASQRTYSYFVDRYVKFFFRGRGVEYWCLNSELHTLLSRCSTTWAILPAVFLLGIFEIYSGELFCPGWFWITILLIFASWVARIIGMNHQGLAGYVKFSSQYY
jgi:hypothetical protein